VPDFIASGDALIAFDAVGSGPPLVLMHGAEASRLMFGALVPLLAPHFTVIAYDQRDCGDTESPERAATLAELAGDARALIEALGHTRAHVLGSSYGGRVAQMLAATHPQVVDRLVLGSTWPLPRSLAELSPVSVAQIGELRSRLPESAEELATLFFPDTFLAERPDLRRFFANVRPESDRSRRRAAAVDDAPAIDLAKIEAKTLLIAGELDRVVPMQITLAMAAQLQRCEQIVLPGVGHGTALQAPQAVAHHLTHFLKEATP
jgi:pimeloyl-ACP methyl ester carboxylesterase